MISKINEKITIIEDKLNEIRGFKDTKVHDFEETEPFKSGLQMLSRNVSDTEYKGDLIKQY